MEDSPCYGCTERHLICHDTCDRFARYKARIKAKKDARERWLRANGSLHAHRNEREEEL